MGNTNSLYTVSPFSPECDKTDYHIHTVFSDGKNTMVQCVQAAMDKGLTSIAFTDHIWRTSDWVDTYIEECHKLRAMYPDIDIHIGAEAKAIDLKGEVDISQDNADKLDFVTGSVHRRLPDEPDERFRDLRQLAPEDAARAETDIIVAMTKNPLVDIIGHPMRLYYKFFHNTEKTSAPFPVSLLQEILSAVKRSGKKIELNYNLPDVELVIDLYRKSGASFLLGSDAHEAGTIGNIPFEEITRQCHQAQ